MYVVVWTHRGGADLFVISSEARDQIGKARSANERRISPKKNYLKSFTTKAKLIFKSDLQPRVW